MNAFKRKYITIDITTLEALLRRIPSYEEKGYIVGGKIQGATRYDTSMNQFSKIFDLEKMKFDTNGIDLDHGATMFANQMETDGYGSSFHFAHSAHEGAALPYLEPEDFDEEELTFHLWGVDSGQNSIFVGCSRSNKECDSGCKESSNGCHEEESHQVIQCTTAEYYFRSGYKKTVKKISKLRSNNPTYIMAEKQLKSSKTSDLALFHQYLDSLFNYFDTLVNFYKTIFHS